MPHRAEYQVLAERYHALDSPDFKDPRGAKNDNTTCPAFIKALNRRFDGKVLKILDLGCAGGGLVETLNADGHEAIGLDGGGVTWDGSNPLLYHADISYPIGVIRNDEWAKFNIIMMWEVLEHIPMGRIDCLIANIRRHLEPSGSFIASVATFADGDHHQTIKAEQWWRNKFRMNLLYPYSSVPMGLEIKVEDLPRGTGNGPMDWDFRTNPEMGFHIAAHL